MSSKVGSRLSFLMGLDSIDFNCFVFKAVNESTTGAIEDIEVLVEGRLIESHSLYLGS